jgi:hypothetical protein
VAIAVGVTITIIGILSAIVAAGLTGFRDTNRYNQPWWNHPGKQIRLIMENEA